MTAISSRAVSDGRTYRLTIPSSLERPAAAVLLLHGAGGTAAWAAHETRFDAAAEKFGFVAVYPEAVPIRPGDPPAFLKNPPVWNDGSRRWPRDSEPDDLAYLCAVLDDLLTAAPVDEGRVHVAGFSNGASMAFRAVAELGDRFASLVAVAGYCHVQAVGRPVPTMYVIGDADPLVPMAGGTVVSPWTGRAEEKPPVSDVLARWAKLIGCTTDPRPTSQYDGVTIAEYPGPVPLRSVTIAGLGHHWPGGRGLLKRKLAGEPSDRFDLNRAIVDWIRQRDGG